MVNKMKNYTAMDDQRNCGKKGTNNIHDIFGMSTRTIDTLCIFIHTHTHTDQRSGSKQEKRTHCISFFPFSYPKQVAVITNIRSASNKLELHWSHGHTRLHDTPNNFIQTRKCDSKARPATKTHHQSLHTCWKWYIKTTKGKDRTEGKSVINISSIKAKISRSAAIIALSSWPFMRTYSFGITGLFPLHISKKRKLNELGITANMHVKYNIIERNAPPTCWLCFSLALMWTKRFYAKDTHSIIPLRLFNILWGEHTFAIVAFCITHSRT